MSPSHRSATERFTIRAAAEGDLEDIVAIERRSFSDPWSAASFSPLLGRSEVLFLVATECGAAQTESVAGYAVAYHAAGEGEIANVAVAPETRGLGLGAMLVNALLDAMRAAGVLDSWLEVRSSNHAARVLYEHLGFDAVGVRTRYYARPVEDAIVMRRGLRNS